MSIKTGQNLTTRPTLEMLVNLAGFITSMLARLSFDQVEYLIANKNTILRKKLQEVFEIPVETKKHLDIKVGSLCNCCVVHNFVPPVSPSRYQDSGRDFKRR